jgi:hypothetical protein
MPQNEPMALVLSHPRVESASAGVLFAKLSILEADVNIAVAFAELDEG